MPNRTAADRAMAPAIGVGIVLLALFVSTATLGRPTDLPDTGAAAWLPADGTRQRFTGPHGVLGLEWAVDRAVTILGSGPLPFYSWMSRTQVDWQTATLARVSSVLTTPDGEVRGREDDLFSIADDGVRAEAEVPVPGNIRIYLPGRLDIPADLASGRSWTSEGQVVEYSGADETTTSYRADYTARPVEPGAAAADLIALGCVAVTMRLQVGDSSQASEQTWCRHSGAVAFRSDAGEWRPDAPGPPFTASGPDPGLDWSTAASLAFSPLAINRVGTLGSTVVSPVTAPGILPDGGLVFDNQTTRDVLSFRTGGDVPLVFWRGRAGGRITTSAVLGDVTVAAGGSRWLVAWGTAGQWLWQHRLPDLAVAPPVRLGDLVVVATLDGQVTAFDLGSGRERWSYTASAEIRVAPVAAGDRVLVADQAGQLTCLDSSGTEVWAVDAGRAERFAVWTPPDGGTPLVVVPQAGGSHVQALSLEDGSRAWRIREFADAKDVLTLDRVVVLRDYDETVALDPATGAVRWRWRDARTYAGAGGGQAAMLLAPGRVLLVDDTGTTVRQWPVDVGDITGSTSFLVASQGRVLVYGPGGVEVGAVP